MAAHPEYADYAVTVEPVGKGDAASNMLTDLDAGADIFNFAQNQLARLVAAGALIELSEENAAGSVAAATMADLVYAYPLTSDNGYFLYYDKSFGYAVSPISARYQILSIFPKSRYPFLSPREKGIKKNGSAAFIRWPHSCFLFPYKFSISFP